MVFQRKSTSIMPFRIEFINLRNLTRPSLGPQGYFLRYLVIHEYKDLLYEQTLFKKL